MKKFYLLSILMLLPLMASADDSGSCGENVTWTYVEESQKLIISGSGPMEDYVNEISLPISSASYASNKVPWKSYIEKIQVVEINEGVTTIGAGAFSSIKTLASVTIPNSVTSIGGGAFYGPIYKDLNSVTIPSSVTSIGTYAFLRGLSSINVDEGNQAFTSVDGVLFNKDMSKLIAYPANKEDASYIIPNSVTVIENGAFSRAKCTSLTIPNSVTTIGESAFYSTSISSYMIPSSVSSIGVEAFDLARCSSIDVEDGNLHYTSSDGVLFNKDMTTLIYYPPKKPGESYTIPNSVTTIDIDAFHASHNLTSVTIPSSVISIGETAFFGCDKLVSLDIPSSVTSIGRGAFRECDVLTSMIIPDHVAVINFSILSLCKSLTTVTLGSGVTSIENSIFANSENLKDVYCLAVDVPQTNSSTFKDTPIENMTLHVPAGSLEAYKAAERWSGFGTILPIGDSPAVQAEPYAVLSDDNTVLTFYYDDQKAARNGMGVGPFTESYDKDRQRFNINSGWDEQRESITSVVFDESFANCTTLTSTACWFYGLQNLSSITGISNLKTDNVTAMLCMFQDCSSLTSLDVTGFKTDNVTSMYCMFFGCSGLKSIDVSGFKTDNVTNMARMFCDCSGLTSLDLMGFKTDNVTNMSGMFTGCSGLKSIDVSGFKTDNVTDMSWMFYGCFGLTSLDVTGFKTDNVTDMNGMFYNCSGLTSLDVTGFKTDNVTAMLCMFQDCSGLTSLDVTGFKTDNVTDMSWMFFGCSGLTSLDVTGFKTDNVTGMVGMFSGCSSLKTIYAGNGWSTANVQYGGDMFTGCTSLIGGAGTRYDESHTDHTYARIDGGASNPGYFTKKSTTDKEDVDEITIKEIGKTTWCSEYDLDFTNVAGIKAYTATGYDNIDKTIWLTRVMKVPAGTGLLVKGDPGTYKIPHAEVQSAYANWFVGNLGEAIKIEETDGDKTNYYLSGKDGTFVSVNGSANIGKNKAYLQLPTSVFGGTRSIGISYDDEDGTTGVKEAKSGVVKSDEWYTLQGQRVAKPGKGLYIKNGKKVIVR